MTNVSLKKRDFFDKLSLDGEFVTNFVIDERKTIIVDSDEKQKVQR